LIDGGEPIKRDKDLGEATHAESANPKGNDYVACAPAATSVPRLPELELPIYDPAAFQEIAGFVSSTNIATYVETVIEQSEHLLDRLRAPIPAAADRGDLALSAHVLSGRAGMFGFQRLALGAQSYEQAIGTGARRELQRALGAQVHLDVSVRVRRDWRGDEGLLDRLGIT